MSAAGPRPEAPGWDRPQPANRNDPTAEQPVSLKTVDRFVAEYEPLHYTVEPIVRSGSLYTITARTGAGKTAWFISVAMAVATGRRDIIGLETDRGRVALLTFENPDDVRMRLLVAGYAMGVDLGELSDWLMILDQRARPEAITETLTHLSSRQPFRLILVDTLAAFFDGDNINDAVQGGQFMRRLRPMTRLSGLPSVIVAAHPVKNAAEDNLLPYGSGAILNEVDGNLTLWRKPDTEISTLHWQGKLRGLEFAPASYRMEVCGSPDVLDSKGRQVVLPYMVPTSVTTDEARQAAEDASDATLLKLVHANPKGTQREWAEALGRSVSVVNTKLKRLAAEKLIEKTLGRWNVTTKGEKALQSHP